MSLRQDIDKSAVQLSENSPEDLPCSDKEFKDGIEFLSASSPVFQRYRRELQQFVIDQLCGANCMIEASISKDGQIHQVVLTERMRLLQEINRNVMARVRGVSA